MCSYINIYRLAEHQDLFNIQFNRFIQMFRDIFAVFLSLLYTFRQKILNLTIDGAKIIFCPCGDGIV